MANRPSPAPQAPVLNGHAAPEGGRYAPEAPRTYPINGHSAVIIARLVEDEENKKQAYLAASQARMAVIESTAAAMGLEAVTISADKEGRLMFVEAGPGLPPGAEIEVEGPA